VKLSLVRYLKFRLIRPSILYALLILTWLLKPTYDFIFVDKCIVENICYVYEILDLHQRWTDLHSPERSLIMAPVDRAHDILFDIRCNDSTIFYWVCVRFHISEIVSERAYIVVANRKSRVTHYFAATAKTTKFKFHTTWLWSSVPTAPLKKQLSYR